MERPDRVHWQRGQPRLENGAKQLAPRELRGANGIHCQFSDIPSILSLLELQLAKLGIGLDCACGRTYWALDGWGD